MILYNILAPFIYFFWRDLYVYRANFRRSLINYGIIYPLLYALAFGLFLPSVIPSLNNALGRTLLLAGSFLWLVYPIGFNLNIGLLYDFEADKFINYQLTLLSPRLLLLEKILSSSLIGFLYTLPMLPLSKLLLGSLLDTTQTSWLKIMSILYLSSLLSCVITIFNCSFLKDSRFFRSFLVRFYGPLIQFGGLFMPYKTMAAFSPFLALALYINPFIYITEGLRGALLGDSAFMPFIWCVIALFLFSGLFTLLAFYFFKKKTDHI